MESRYNAAEYVDILVTLELSASLARKDRRPVNATLRACWSVLRQRTTNTLNRQIFDGVSRQPMPWGALCMLRRQFEEMVR